MKTWFHWPSFRGLYLSRLREFYRQPARIFWVYGFPTILAVVLGLAFKSKPQEEILVDLVQNDASAPIEQALKEFEPRAREMKLPIIRYKLFSLEEAVEKRLKTGKTPLVVEGKGASGVVYHLDETRPEATAARSVFDDQLQRARGRTDVFQTTNALVTEPGSRYIDFLIPGLIGLNTMGGGLWGVGFLIVNFRIAKLLKRFRATPMPRSNFLLAILAARLTFLLPDVGVLLALGKFAFQMPVKGSLITLIIVELAGALAFAGIGLLVASRASSTETVSGLMNLVMVPMWLLSGVFFSADRFPSVMQPLIQALPLTQLVSALRRVLLEGADLVQVAPAVGIMSAWAVVCFWLALRLFRWS